MEFLKTISRFLYYFFISLVVCIAMVFIYGQFDQFAGYFLFVAPVAAFFSACLLALIGGFTNVTKLKALALCIPTSLLGYVLVILLMFAL